MSFEGFSQQNIDTEEEKSPYDPESMTKEEKEAHAGSIEVLLRDIPREERDHVIKLIVAEKPPAEQASAEAHLQAIRKNLENEEKN